MQILLSMKKALFLLLCLTIQGTLAHTTPSLMSETVSIPLTPKTGTHDNEGRPRTINQNLVNASVDTEMGNVTVSVLIPIGNVDVFLINESNGTMLNYTFDSSQMAVLPLENPNGYWIISLTFDDNSCFYGSFYL